MGNLSSKQIPLQTYLHHSLNISRQLDLSEATVSRAGDEDYQVTGWRMEADTEETRPVREVRIGLIQNKIVLPTDAPINQQVSMSMSISVLTFTMRSPPFTGGSEAS